MITPLGQRQVLTTAALEAVRVAHQGAVQGQQVEAQRQAFVARQAEGLHEVPNVEESEAMRLDPEGRRGGGMGQGDQGASHEEEREGGEGQGAASAEGHLDFLA